MAHARRRRLHHGLVVCPVAGALGASDAVAGTLSASTPAELTMTVVCPGRTPERIETDVTVPIEKALDGLPGVARIRSNSWAGVSQTIVALSGDVGADTTVATVRAAIARIDPSPPCPVRDSTFHPRGTGAPML